MKSRTVSKPRLKVRRLQTSYWVTSAYDLTKHINKSITKNFWNAPLPLSYTVLSFRNSSYVDFHAASNNVIQLRSNHYKIELTLYFISVKSNESHQYLKTRIIFFKMNPFSLLLDILTAPGAQEKASTHKFVTSKQIFTFW